MDRAEFDSWVWQVGPALHRTGFLMTGDWTVSRDLVVDACARTHADWAKVQAPESYARSLIARAAVGERRGGAGSGHSAHAGLAGLLGDEPVGDQDRRASLTQALDSLPPRERTVLVLQYYDGLTEDQVAVDLDLAVETVRTATDHALDVLRDWGLDDGWES